MLSNRQNAIFIQSNESRSPLQLSNYNSNSQSKTNPSLIRHSFAEPRSVNQLESIKTNMNFLEVVKKNQKRNSESELVNTPLMKTSNQGNRSKSKQMLEKNLKKVNVMTEDEKQQLNKKLTEIVTQKLHKINEQNENKSKDYLDM